MSNKPRQRPDPIHEMAVRLAGALSRRAKAAYGPLLNAKEPLEYFAFDASTDAEELSTVAGEVFDELEKRNLNPGFESGAEIRHFVLQFNGNLDSHEWETDESAAWATYANELAVALTSAVCPYEFEVRFTEDSLARNSYTLDLTLGGINDLDVTTERAAEGPAVTVLGGRVSAATVGGAIAKTERVLDEFLGVMFTLELMEEVGSLPKPALPIVRLWGGERLSNDGEEFALSPVFADVLRAMRLRYPRDLFDLEKTHLRRGTLDPALQRHIKRLRNVIAGPSERAGELRRACRLAANAARFRDFGVLVTLAFACLEGLFSSKSDKEDVTSRLADAVAYLLGRSVEERDALRREVKKLYNLRSIFVHTGKAAEDSRSRGQVLALMNRVLRNEIALLPEVEGGADDAQGFPDPPKPEAS